MGDPQLLGTLLKAGGMVIGGTLALSAASSITVKVVQSVTEAKRKSLAKPCEGCRGKGFYVCKLCKGNATIEWSPLYGPIHINPCQCPTCESQLKMGDPQLVGTLLKAGGMVIGGTLVLSAASSVTVKVVQSVTEVKSLAKACQGCRGKGFYVCKLCNGNAMIEWSPLYDPIHINPCQCPTCEGHRLVSR